MRADERLTQWLENGFEREQIFRTIVHQKQLHPAIFRHPALLCTESPGLEVRETSRGGISLNGSTSASGTIFNAAAGIATLSAVFGSWTIPLPPRSTMCLSPRAPS